jgi:hypothetical protein
LTSVLSDVARRFNRWRLVFAIFLLVYAALLLLYLDYAPINWDETPHLVGGLLLSRGQLQEYTQAYLFYPPLYDFTTVLYYTVLGASVFSARLVALTFGVLSVWLIFEVTYRIQGPKTAMLSGVLLASMPGLIVLSRLALIETMLVFFFSISLFLFYGWIRTNNSKLLLLSGVTLGLGFIVKYQILVAGMIMLVTGLFMWKNHIRKKIGKFLLLAVIAGVVVLPWVFLVYQSGRLDTWLYAIQVGNEERTLYSERFYQPIFYLIEMTYPYMDIHPISLPIYILSFLGLAYWLWRRKLKDKFFLIWFLVTYIFFTLIPNKNWRYITPVFPVLAISTADFLVFFWGKVTDALKAYKNRLSRIDVNKIAAAIFVFFIGASVVFSLNDAYYWVEKEHVKIPIKEACQYLSENSAVNEPVIVLFTGNFFSTEMVKFYLRLYDSGERELWPYPENPVDAYKPVFNETYLIEQCEGSNVKYLLLYEHGNITYFESTWKSNDVQKMLLDSGSFSKEMEFGSYPRHIYIMRFLLNS